MNAKFCSPLHAVYQAQIDLFLALPCMPFRRFRQSEGEGGVLCPRSGPAPRFRGEGGVGSQPSVSLVLGRGGGCGGGADSTLLRSLS